MRKNPISKAGIVKISDAIEDINNGLLVLDHPLQRRSKQWGREQQGNLIRRVLHDGQFLPILICTQYDKNGCEVQYLIDGVQRMTTFAEFINDEFAINKNIIDYMISYDGILYEQKKNKAGKFSLKRDRNKNLIPILDEQGNKQRVSQQIDIRGLKFSDLPPELQNKIKKYNVSVQYKLECTDEDIQIEILDYNNGTKMNEAQIGKNRLGAEFASIVTDLSNHDFILNKCGFSSKDRTKGTIERAINEALMVVNFGTDEWVLSHKDLCRKLANWLTIEHTEGLKRMFDELDNILPEDEDVKKLLSSKDFFIVMGNYEYFKSTNYKPECYGMFIEKLAKELLSAKIILTGNVDDNGNDIYESYKKIYESGTKQKSSVEERLLQINKFLDDFLSENCSEMIDSDDIDDSNNDIINDTVNDCVNDTVNDDIFMFDESDTELIDYAQNFTSDELAIQTLMLVSDCPYAIFNKKTYEKCVEWYREFGDSCLLDDCIDCKKIAIGTGNIKTGIEEDDINLPFYAYAVKYIITNNVDIDFEQWISDFRKTAFKDIEYDNSNAMIMLKQNEIIQSIQKYLEKENYKNVAC